MAPGDAGLDGAFSHCIDEVRRGDPDRAVALAFAPADTHGALSALYAFDLETARIRDQVSQPLPGEIRLQWWRDRLSAEAEDPMAAGEGSPVAGAFLATVRRFSLPVDAVERLLDARVFDLYDDVMPDRVALEAYAGETASAVTMLAAMILDRDAAPACAEAAGHAGVALAIRDILATAVSRPERAQAFVPDELFAATGVERAGWAASPGGRNAGEGGTTTQALFALAREHVGRVEALWPSVPRTLRPALLPSVLVRSRLTVLERAVASGDRAASVPPIGPLRRSFLYWRAMRAPERGGR